MNEGCKKRQGKQTRKKYKHITRKRQGADLATRTEVGVLATRKRNGRDSYTALLAETLTAKDTRNSQIKNGERKNRTEKRERETEEIK